MSSSVFNVGRLERKFIYGSSGNPNETKLRYNDPSFVTFRVLFDFDPIISADEVMQGLLLNEARDESAINYLRRMGEFERADALKEFVWLLGRITNDFPWFFKTINGIDGLWNWGYASDEGTTQSAPVDLTIDCYETVDMRITALADLYRKASRDRMYFRDLLTIDKKRFNMTVIMGEARNLRTFIDSNNSDWLNNVSAVAFRCLDCEFDFSKIISTSVQASEAPQEISPSFGIKVHRVQETNSYLLLDYMLGEMKRDFIIRQGGSGANVNSNIPISDYRSLLGPFIRSYEGNYNQVLLDVERNISQNFLNSIQLSSSDRISQLSYPERDRINRQELDGISKVAENASIANALMTSSMQVASIIQTESVINFGVPTVNEEIKGGVDLISTKIEEDVANQIEFTKPKVETQLSEFSLNRPKVETDIDQNIGFIEPTVQRELNANIGLTAPTINGDQGEDIQFTIPSVETRIDRNVGFVSPTVDTSIDQSIQFEKPTVETGIDQSISFGRPSVLTTTDDRIDFNRPSVLGTISEKIAFEKPKVEDGFGS